MSREVVLYGAGSDIHKALMFLHVKKIKPLCIADSNSKKWGGAIEGVRIVSPDNIREYDSKTIIITASHFDDVYKGLTVILKEDFSNYEILVAPYLWLMLVNVEYNDKLLISANNFIRQYKDDLYSMYNLEDNITKQILDYIVRVRIKTEYAFEKYIDSAGMQYVDGYFYYDELKTLPELSIIDVGAYVGDTVDEMFERYGNAICNYYAYEPEKNNYEKLNNYLLEQPYANKVKTFNCALGSHNSEITFGKEDGCFGVLENVEEAKRDGKIVKVVPLSDENLTIDGKLVIKMDVEGFELEVIKGALGYIKEYRPYMAICVYHRVEDIYTIPAFISEQVGDYTFILRSGVHTHLVAIPRNM